ncbi:dr1-associated corepressor [Halyomorpha halys]|uniref:dr1-associated corepressor n=1 Tax=Halyomorpha halys TaxID=286706 RepID=UPI0006D4FA3C|nr:dr1-associated corepressor [Halyomorpha halys]
MPSKKKKYNARFPAGRIKKIMQTDEEVGKVAQAVPVIISRTLELFVESLITKTMEITTMKNARTLSPHHMKQCILSENRFDFLRDLVKSVPEVSVSDDDLGSFSDNSSSVHPAARRSSREDSEMVQDDSPPPADGSNFVEEDKPSDDDQHNSDTVDEWSLQIDESEPKPEESLPSNSVITPLSKNGSDSEDNP